MPQTGRILIDDLESAPAARLPPLTGPAGPCPGRLGPGEREDWLRRYNLSPIPIEFEDEDPHSARYMRTDLAETPGTILHYWFGYAAERTSTLGDRMSLWFGGGFELDRIIANRFADIVARLASGEAYRWSAMGVRERLAAIIALDQFTRSIFRGAAAAFENDPIALRLAKEAIVSGEDMTLKPVERWFLYMPLEHSESSSDQRRSLDRFSELLSEATPDLQPHLTSAYEYAKRHAAVIKKFGRFPHRNASLGRMTTSAERKFLERPGSNF